MNSVSLGAHSATVRAARLTLYHLDGDEADWNLEAELAGAWESLQLSGTAPTPVDPGPVSMRLAHIDAPEEVVVEGVAGGLTNGGRDVFLKLSWIGDRARIRGHVALEWFGFEWDVTSPIVLELDMEADVVREGQ